MTAILLVSGGIESTTLLYRLRDEPGTAVFIDYGQRAAAEEARTVKLHCAGLGRAWVPLEMAKVGEAFRAEQTQKLHVPLPHRNLVALSLALSYAAQRGAGRIYLALNREDTETYPSAGIEFITRFNALARVLGNIAVVTPLSRLRKSEIIRLGATLGVNYAATYSCLLGHARHCGRCPQCRKRRAAFAEAGIAEPEGFYQGG